MSFATKRSINTNTSNVPQAKASVAHKEMRQAALCITGLSFFDDITHASQGSNKRLLAVSINFSTQPVDVNVHYIGIGLNAHAPHLVQDHGAGHDATRVAAEIFQQNKLLRSELQGLSGSRCLPSQKIEFKVEHTKTGGLSPSGAVSFEQIPEASQQFRQG